MSKTPKTPLPRAVEGAPVSAAAINALVDRIEQGILLRGGQGLDVRGTGTEWSIALASTFQEHVVLAIIIAKTGADIDLPPNIQYTVQEYGTENTLGPVAPSWGRPTKRDDVEIEAAAVGSICFIVRRPIELNRTEALLWIPSGGYNGETLAFFECPTAPPPTPAAALRREERVVRSGLVLNFPVDGLVPDQGVGG